VVAAVLEPNEERLIGSDHGLCPGSGSWAHSKGTGAVVITLSDGSSVYLD